MATREPSQYQTLCRLRSKTLRDLIQCPLCKETITMKQFTNHVKTMHGVDTRSSCIYCLGCYKWLSGTKLNEENTRHILNCLKKFLKINRIQNEFASTTTTNNNNDSTTTTNNNNSSTTTTNNNASTTTTNNNNNNSATTTNNNNDADITTNTYTTNNNNESNRVIWSFCMDCRNFKPVPCDLCGRKRDRKSEYILLFESLFEKPEMWQTGINLFNEASGFHNDLIGIVKRFLQNDLKWYHIMVRANAFDTFVKEMEKIKGEIVLLPYWCLCDGLTKNRIVHRHMILACELESSFEFVWKYRVRYDIKDNGRCKDSVRIKNVFHLVNCIQYVSEKKASCDGVKIRDSVNETKFRESHFYINRPLPKHGIAVLCMLFDGGIEKLMSQVNQNKNVVNWMDDAIHFYDKSKNDKWGVALKKTGFKYLNCTIPVRRELEPTAIETDLYLTWINERKIYFEENFKLLELSTDEWYKYQFEKGNTFQSVGDDIYVYGRKQQNVMHQLKVRENLLNNRFDVKYSEMETEKAKIQSKKRKYREERDIFQREITSLKAEMANMRHNFNMTLSEIRNDIEIKRLKLEIESLKTENEGLRKKIKILYQFFL